MRNLPAAFVIPDDEWYTYDHSPRPNVRVLARVDESSYTTKTDVKMGDHPVIWTNPYKSSRNVYFQFGHSQQLFATPAFIQLLENALHWTLRDHIEP